MIGTLNLKFNNLALIVSGKSMDLGENKTMEKIRLKQCLFVSASKNLHPELNICGTFNVCVLFSIFC